MKLTDKKTQVRLDISLNTEYAVESADLIEVRTFYP